MRQVILDTETTGLDPQQGHRVIEIGCVELVDRRVTGRTFHQYLQPDRAIDAGARNVHGITDEFLADKPRFADVAHALLDFLRDAELVIHNAPFDVGFLNHELRLLGAEWGALADHCREVTDTLVLARRLHPGQRASLDALCKRYEIDNSGRELHGALKDARILCDVYLAMTGGQATLALDAGQQAGAQAAPAARAEPGLRSRLRVLFADTAELAAHVRCLDAVDKASKGRCLWRRQEPGASPKD